MHLALIYHKKTGMGQILKAHFYLTIIFFHATDINLLGLFHCIIIAEQLYALYTVECSVADSQPPPALGVLNALEPVLRILQVESDIVHIRSNSRQLPRN